MTPVGAATRCNPDAQVDDLPMQCNYGAASAGRIGMGGTGCERQVVLVLREPSLGAWFEAEGAIRRFLPLASPKSSPEADRLLLVGP